MATPIILDVDTGIDDAVAIMLAAKSRRMDIKAITTVFGNSTVDITTLNTLRVLELLGLKDIPVAAGAKKGILSPLKAAQRGRGLPGNDGMMGLADKLPFPKKSPEQISACELMEKTVSESQNKVIFICMGPLTNMAVFLTAHPHLRSKISGIVVTGGSAEKGDVLPSVEFNISADPEAAHIVFNSGVRVMVCGLEVTDKAYMTFEERERIKLDGGRCADAFYPFLKKFGEYNEEVLMKDGCVFEDPVSVAWLLDPSMFKSVPYRISVDLTGRYTRGTTICASPEKENVRPNAMMAVDIDRERFVEMLSRAFAPEGPAEQG